MHTSKKLLVFPFIILFTLTSYAQKKEANAIYTDGAIKIDGILDESEWDNAIPTSGMYMFEPDNGNPLAPHRDVEIRVLYNNTSIYIGALLKDDAPHLIPREITQRDRFGVADHFGVYINGFNDGQQDFRFFVSAAGVQMDCLATETGEDYSWDAIWDSAVKITDEGWVIEMEIPYAALRFSNVEEQVWGINFYREFRRDRYRYAWNPIDARIGAIIPQAGLLKGIKNINPPTRLFLIPYGSSYVETRNGQTETTFKAGLDIKYGINDSFTLDAILIPDFGQAAFDDVILNLTPFEQQFLENRPFFTEGTDIFNKGNLLYTRRIGGAPSRRATPDADETITYTPGTVNLINATKISGRTKGGLGIGFLNAVTESAFANLRNNETGETRRALVEPLTNYNVTVFDQRFRGNSSVAFINTNVWRDGDFRDANVSALVFDLNTRGNTYKLAGDFKYSLVRDLLQSTGFSTQLNFAKTHSQHRYNILGTYMSEDFNPNDLGINFMTNFHSLRANYNYRTLNPVGWFNSIRINSNFYTEIQNTTGRAQQFWQNIIGNVMTKNNDFFNSGLYINPVETYDFYEARSPGRFVNIPGSWGTWLLFSSNYNRTWAIDIEPAYRKYWQDNRDTFTLLFSPRYRFSDKFSLIYRYQYVQQNSDIGWADFWNNQPILAERDRVTQTHSLTGKYSLNDKSTFNLVLRYYHSWADNLVYMDLNSDGSFSPSPDYDLNRDANLNLWNFDLSYSWWFAPGSELRILYRNNADEFSLDVNKNPGENINALFRNNLNHIFSLSLRYFIDYNKVKNWI
ncbi:MAG: DUF5916 domain-containing protein [Flavobacterium sp.]